MIFDELSNVSFLFVPRRLGSELDEGGGCQDAAPLLSRHRKFRSTGPARANAWNVTGGARDGRIVKNILVAAMFFKCVFF